MSARLTISIPERNWKSIADAPLNGTMMFLRDENGIVDLGMYDRGEWLCELETMIDEPAEFAVVSIATKADHDGCCGRCGRYREGS